MHWSGFAIVVATSAATAVAAPPAVPSPAMHLERALPPGLTRADLFRKFDFRTAPPLLRAAGEPDSSFAAPHEAAASPSQHLGTEPPVFLRSDVTLPLGWTVADNAAVHAESGLVCLGELDFPELKRRYELVAVRTFDRKGLDAGCHYQGSDGQELSFFASFWPDMTVEQHAQGAVAAINQTTPIVRELPVSVVKMTEDPAKPYTVNMEPVLAGAFEIAVDGKPVKTAIWLTKTYGWHVKARATYAPTDEATEALTAVVFAVTHMSVRMKNMQKPTAVGGSEV